jgi:hypothetical protein
VLGVPELVSGQAGTWRVLGYFEYRDSRVQLGLEYRDLAGWSIGTWRVGVSGLGGLEYRDLAGAGTRVLGHRDVRVSGQSGCWHSSGRGSDSWSAGTLPTLGLGGIRDQPEYRDSYRGSQRDKLRD